MHRLFSLILLAACAPTIAEDAVDPRPTDDDPPVEDPACNDVFEVGSTWSFAHDDYGMSRAVSAFDGPGDTFVHASGVYQTTTRVFDVRTGEVQSSDTVDGRQLIERDSATDTDLIFVDGALEIRSTRTGRLRGSVPDVGPSWMAPGVVLDGNSIAILHCDDTQRGWVAMHDLNGSLIAEAPRPGFCQSWVAAPLDFDEATQVVVVADGAAGAVFTFGESAPVRLTPHDPDPDAPSIVELVHDVAVSPDGRIVATAGRDGRLLFHAADAGELLADRPVRVTPVNQNIYAPPDTRSPFAWSDDGRLLARGLSDDTIVVERLCDGQILATLDIDSELTPPFVEDGAAPATLHFAPDGGALIAVYEGGVQGYVVE